EDGRADVALALLELLARRVDSGPQHGAGGLHGLAGAREVVVLHVMAELVGTGAEVGRDLVGLLPQALLGLGRVLVVQLGGPGAGLAGTLGDRRADGGGELLQLLDRLLRLLRARTGGVGRLLSLLLGLPLAGRRHGNPRSIGSVGSGRRWSLGHDSRTLPWTRVAQL